VSHESLRRRERTIWGAKMVGGSFLERYTSPLHIKCSATTLLAALMKK